MTSENDSRDKRLSQSEGKEKSQGLSGNGYQDPTGEYPRPPYWNSSNVNYAIQGSKRNDLWFGGSVSGLDFGLGTPSASIYPYNQVDETVSGHITEIDDTPGNERMLFRHRTGAGVEFRNDGTVVVSSVNNRIEVTGSDHKVVVEGDGNIHYKGNLDLHVSGEYNVHCNDYNIYTSGNHRTYVRGSKWVWVAKHYWTYVLGIWNNISVKHVINTYLNGLTNNIKGVFNNYVDGPANYLSSKDTVMTSQTKINQSAPDQNIAAQNLSVFGDKGTIGGKNIIMYNYNMYTGHTVWAKDTLHTNTIRADRINVNGDIEVTNSVTAPTFHGDLMGRAEEAVEAAIAKSQEYAEHETGEDPEWSVLNYAINTTPVLDDSASTARPTQANLTEYLGKAEGGIRSVVIDKGNHIKNYVDKTSKFGGVVNTFFDKEISSSQIRSRLRDQANQTNSSFVSNATAEGGISPNYSRPTPIGVGRVLSSDPTPLIGRTKIGNAVATSGVSSFIPKMLKQNIIPDNKYNPDFQIDITASTKLAEGITIAKFLGTEDPTNIKFIRNIETRKKLARHLYIHAEIMRSLTLNRGNFQDYRLVVAESVYRPGPEEIITPNSINDLKLKGRAVVYDLVDNHGKSDRAKVFELAEYWKDTLLFEKLILSYDEIDPNVDLHAQLIVILPEINENWEGTFQRQIETVYNNNLLSKGELVECLTFPVEAAETVPPVTSTTPTKFGINKTPGLNPITDTLAGTSNRLKPGALANMQSLLQNEYKDMQEFFGGRLFINDALAKSDTTRVGDTSQHFFGKALDIDVTKMSNFQKRKLVDAALKAGFTGFGFGNTILHVDTGAKRSWRYNNTSFAGKDYKKYWRAFVA